MAKPRSCWARAAEHQHFRMARSIGFCKPCATDSSAAARGGGARLGFGGPWRGGAGYSPSGRRRGWRGAGARVSGKRARVPFWAVILGRVQNVQGTGVPHFFKKKKKAGERDDRDGGRKREEGVSGAHRNPVQGRGGGGCGGAEGEEIITSPPVDTGGAQEVARGGSGPSQPEPVNFFFLNPGE